MQHCEKVELIALSALPSALPAQPRSPPTIAQGHALTLHFAAHVKSLEEDSPHRRERLDKITTSYLAQLCAALQSQ